VCVQDHQGSGLDSGQDEVELEAAFMNCFQLYKERMQPAASTKEQHDAFKQSFYDITSCSLQNLDRGAPGGQLLYAAYLDDVMLVDCNVQSSLTRHLIDQTSVTGVTHKLSMYTDCKSVYLFYPSCQSVYFITQIYNLCTFKTNRFTI